MFLTYCDVIVVVVSGAALVDFEGRMHNPAFQLTFPSVLKYRSCVPTPREPSMWHSKPNLTHLRKMKQTNTLISQIKTKIIINIRLRVLNIHCERVRISVAMEGVVAPRPPPPPPDAAARLGAKQVALLELHYLGLKLNIILLFLERKLYFCIYLFWK